MESKLYAGTDGDKVYIPLFKLKNGLRFGIRPMISAAVNKHGAALNYGYRLRMDGITNMDEVFKNDVLFSVVRLKSNKHASTTGCMLNIKTDNVDNLDEFCSQVADKDYVHRVIDGVVAMVQFKSSVEYSEDTVKEACEYMTKQIQKELSNLKYALTQYNEEKALEDKKAQTDTLPNPEDVKDGTIGFSQMMGGLTKGSDQED